MTVAIEKAPYELVDFATIPGVPCPCGTARRALADIEDYPGTIHVTEIALDNLLHYHKRLTETYYFLECEPGAQMQLNDEVLDVRQQARFRVFEENIERRKIELLIRARQQNRPNQQNPPPVRRPNQPPPQT